MGGIGLSCNTTSTGYLTHAHKIRTQYAQDTHTIRTRYAHNTHKIRTQYAHNPAHTCTHNTHTQYTDTRYTHTPQQYRIQIQQSCSTHRTEQHRCNTAHIHNLNAHLFTHIVLTLLQD